MAFKENAQVKDFAQAQVVTAKKFRCPICGWVTRDEQRFKEHDCEKETEEKEQSNNL